MRALLALAFATQLALAVWLAIPSEQVHEIHTHETRIVQLPVPLPIETILETHAASRCPAPRRDEMAFVQPPEDVEVVRPSVTNTAWIAAWNSTSLFVSTNGGASWRRERGDVRDANFDCFGRLFVARGHLAPFDDEGELVVLGGGPDVVIVGAVPRVPDVAWRARIAVSHDRGATWRTRDLVESSEMPVYGRQTEDGAIDVVVHEGDCGGQTPYAFGFDRALVARPSTKLAAYEALANDGIEGIDAYRIDMSIVQGPTSPLVVAKTRVYRYANGMAEPLPMTITDHAGYFVADAAGRIWGVACGKLVRARETRGSDPRAGSSDAAGEAGCDPS